MSIFDTVKKVVMGDVAHDAVDAGNPLKFGGKARTAQPAAVANSDRVDAYFDEYGRLVISSGVGDNADTTALNVVTALLGGIYRTDDNIPSSGIASGSGRSGALRMTRERELVIAPKTLGLHFNSSTVAARGAELSTTSWSAGYAVPVANDFSGSANWTTTGTRWLKIPMRDFVNGITIGMYQNLGSNVTVTLSSEIMSGQTGSGNRFQHRSAITLASGSFLYIQPYALDVTAAANCYSLPTLLMPMNTLVIEMAAASNPSSGQMMIFVGR